MLNRKALLYGISAMSCSMLHSIFVSFYIDYFVRDNIMKPSSHSTDVLKSEVSGAPDAHSQVAALNWFIVGQVVYAAWNALNDLGFGWLADTSYVRVKARRAASASSSIVGRLFPRSALSRRRLSRVAIGGPLWAAAFAFLWYPTPLLRDISPALELSVKMIIYDGFFSYTTVSFRALLVDITSDARQRELCNLYASVFQVIGSVGVMFASLLYEPSHPHPASTAAEGAASLHVGAVQDLSSFRTFCLVWAIVAAVGFMLSATAEGNAEVTLREAHTSEGKVGEDEVQATEGGTETSHSKVAPAEMSFTSFVSQTVRRPGMVTVLIVWFLQDYSCVFATNFFSLFLTLVAGPFISPFARSVLLLVSFVVPHAITIAATPFIPTKGKKFLVSLYFGTRTCVGIAFIFLLWNLSASTLSAAQAYVFAALLLLNRVLTEAVCRTQGLVIGDVCDEDTVAYKRPASMAGAIHGLVNVVSRPSQSVSPVLSCLYLASYGVLLPSEGPQQDGTPTSIPINGSVNGTAATAAPILKLLALTIIVTTVAMQLVWRLWYNLDGPYLAGIRMQMAMRSDKNDSVEDGKASERAKMASGGADEVSVATIVSRSSLSVVARKAAGKASQII